MLEVPAGRRPTEYKEQALATEAAEEEGLNTRPAITASAATKAVTEQGGTRSGWCRPLTG